ncbi:MAG: type II toxin-antitoxin system ParD family antitoxin [Pseudomonadota bacterium]
MSTIQKRTFSITEKQSAFIDKLVERGDYASASEVIREGIRAVQERDAELDAWLRGPVMEAARKLDENPESGIPIDEVFARLRMEQAEDIERSKRQNAAE